MAERAGVSAATASFVLTGNHERRRISAETEQRVRRAADELGYRPNLAARNLRTKSSRTVALVSDTIASEPYAGDFVRGALASAHAHDRLLIIAETEGEQRAEEEVLRGLADRQVDGLVYGRLFTRPVSPPAALALHEVVLLNCLADPLPGPAVVPDEVAGGRTAARGLLDAGHREGIHLVGHRWPGVIAARERDQGIRAELAAAGTRLAGTVDCDWEPTDAFRAVRAMLGRARPRALICLNDRVAMGAYQALAECGLRVPEDVSVVSFDDSELAGWLRPGLSSVALPHQEMGRLATDLLIKGVRHPEVHRVGMLLRHRESIAPPG